MTAYPDPDSTDWRANRVAAALAGRNPTVLAELDHAFAVIRDVRFPGYSLALTKVPGVDRLTDLPRAQRWSEPENALALRTRACAVR